MMANRWLVTATIAGILCVPAVAAVADESAPSWQPTAATSTPKPTESSESGGGSEDTTADDSNGVEGSPVDQYLDTDKARENLESRYENPADVALPPKLLVPKGTSSNSKSASNTAASKFNVYQLQHHGLGPKPTSLNGVQPRLQVIQSSTATAYTIPLNIDNALISFKTPAQDFFDGATNGLLVLATVAITMGATIVVRAKRKDHHHS